MRIPVYNHEGRLHNWTEVDDRDSDLMGWLWRYSSRGYVVRHANGTVQMHRLIMGLELGDPREVDHIDGDKLNNRRSNLRVVSHRQNQQNRKGPNKNSTTGVRGVRFCKQTGRYAAQVTMHGAVHWLGRHDTLEEAEAAVVAFRATHMPYSSDARNAA